MFIHLRTHTEFSIVDGTARIADLVAQARADAQPALAITDLNNLFGAIKFYKAARQAGLQPIVGCEMFLAEYGRLVLLVQNQQGYLNLCELLTQAWQQSHVRKVSDATITLEQLADRHQGLLLLSGTHHTRLGQALIAQDWALAQSWLAQFQRHFGNRFYLEVQRADHPDDEAHVRASLDFSVTQNPPLPLVASHPVQFLQAQDFEAHEARVCIANGEILSSPKRIRAFTPAQHFKTQAEMQALFADIPQALQNSVEIAKRCNLILKLDQVQLPPYPTPPDSSGNPISIEDYFHSSVQNGLQQRLCERFPQETTRERERPRYQERLAFESTTILNMGFAGYFLIVADFINWAKNNDCPVGPGRGSGAGSLVAYALGITDLDPLQYQLLFERFLNPDRVSMPDFDIDFCQNNRDRVIDYVKSKYGAMAVSQIATFGTLAARAAIRDVGRVMDYSYTFCDGISKLIPLKANQPITIAQAIEQEPLLKERMQKEEEVRFLLDMAQQLEGLPRNVGMHAGGVLIAPSRLADFCPLYQQPGSNTAISQFDKDDIEAMGLIKFDFLGLSTLTALELAKHLIRKHYPEEHASFDLKDIALDDPAVYQLFAQARTEAIFQFESHGMRAMLREANPERLEDLIAMNALYRPGPMDLIPSFVARKRGRETVEYPHPLLKPVLQETYGIMVYQEQVMQVAQILGGYSLGQADLLRRAMGKKKPEEMARHRTIFRAGAAKNDIAQATADEIFDLMEKFAGYGFNKSHAAAYSLLAYQTAWIKTHFSAVFFAATMTVEMGNTDRLQTLVKDAKQFGIDFELPNINNGETDFIPVTRATVRYGLGALKGAGTRAIQAIVQARRDGGVFTSLFDFVARVDKTSVNKRTLEALIKAGALDTIHNSRATLLESLDLALEFAQMQADHAHQSGLFDDQNSHAASTHEPQLLAASAWSSRERLAHEKSALGFYLSGHLFDEYAHEVQTFIPGTIAQLREDQEPQWLAGILSNMRFINGKRGKLILLQLEDRHNSIEVACDEALLQNPTWNQPEKPTAAYGLQEGMLLMVQGLVQLDRFSGGLRVQARQILDLAASRCHFGRFFQLTLNACNPQNKAHTSAEQAQQSVQYLHDVLREFAPKPLHTASAGKPMGLKLRVHVQLPGVAACYDLDESHRFYPTCQAIERLRQLDAQARVVYQ